MLVISGGPLLNVLSAKHHHTWMLVISDGDSFPNVLSAKKVIMSECWLNNCGVGCS